MKKRVLQISYRMYIKNFIKLGQLQGPPREWKKKCQQKKVKNSKNLKTSKKFSLKTVIQATCYKLCKSYIKNLIKLGERPQGKWRTENADRLFLLHLWVSFIRFWIKWISIWFKNRKKNCQHDHIPFNLKGNKIRVFSV